MGIVTRSKVLFELGDVAPACIPVDLAFADAVVRALPNLWRHNCLYVALLEDGHDVSFVLKRIPV